MSKRAAKSTVVSNKISEVSDASEEKSNEGTSNTFQTDSVVGSKTNSPDRPTMTEGKDYPHLASMIAHTPDVLIAIDEHFRVLELNPAACDTLGIPAEEAIGCSCAEVLCCQSLNKVQLCNTSNCPHMRALQQQQPLPNEELFIGNTEVSASVTPVEVGEGKVHVIISARNVSSVKVANHVRANFVSMVSHELRTPLNSVHGFIDLLLQGHMGELTLEQRKYLGYAQEGVQQLISIAEDILFLTRSDVGQFEIKPEKVNLRVLTRQVVSSLEPQVHKAEVVLRRDIPSPSPLLYVDPQRMKQVLNNLVINAIKYTPPGGTIIIRARPHDEHFLLLSVEDSGYGIPVEDRPHIFERFYQSNSNRQSIMGGYGLGLSIARLIVEQHGGKIGFDSSLDEGTTFYFTVPLYEGK